MNEESFSVKISKSSKYFQIIFLTILNRNEFFNVKVPFDEFQKKKLPKNPKSSQN